MWCVAGWCGGGGGGGGAGTKRRDCFDIYFVRNPVHFG